MADAPGGWELQRALEQQRADMREGFAGIHARFDKLVTAEAFAAEQRRVDERFRELRRDYDNEVARRQAAVAEEREDREKGDANQQEQLNKLTGNLRWLAVSVALPVALFIANIVINSKGGQ